MAIKKNRNIVIIKATSELSNEIDFNEFEYKDYFKLLCYLIPNKSLEKLEIEEIPDSNFKKSGLVYVFVIGKKIFKIGHTITTIAKRVQSYNCGKTEYRIAGTNSTTNYFVLQSILAMNKKVKVFAYFPATPQYEVFGKKYFDSYPVAKTAEKVIIQSFMEKHNKKPIGCTQS